MTASFPRTSSYEHHCGCRGCFGASPCVLSVLSEQSKRHLIEPPLPARPSRLPPISGAEKRAVNPPLRRSRPGRGLRAEVQAVDARGTAAIACRPAQELPGTNRGPQRALLPTSASAHPTPTPPPRFAPPVPLPYLARPHRASACLGPASGARHDVPEGAGTPPLPDVRHAAVAALGGPEGRTSPAAAPDGGTRTRTGIRTGTRIGTGTGTG